jgi:hypothetical protein
MRLHSRGSVADSIALKIGGPSFRIWSCGRLRHVPSKGSAKTLSPSEMTKFDWRINDSPLPQTGSCPFAQEFLAWLKTVDCCALGGRAGSDGDMRRDIGGGSDGVGVDVCG